MSNEKVFMKDLQQKSPIAINPMTGFRSEQHCLQAWRRKLTIYLATMVGLAWLVYGKTIFYPFFFDDAVNFRLPTFYSLPQIWKTAYGFPYYRPFAYSLWKISLLLLGHYSTTLLHSVMVVFHGINAGLLGWLLASYLKENKALQIFPLVTATLFLLFPFSYQAVVWVASFFHVLVVFLVLNGLVAWRLYVCGRRWGVYVSIGLSILAPFSHESGVIIGPLITLWSKTTEGRYFRKTFLLWPGALLFTGIWLLVPKTRDGQAWVGLKDIFLNGVFFLQGLFYPFFMLLSPLPIPRENIPYVMLVEFIGIAILMGIVVFKRNRWTVLGVGWFFISMIPSILLLPFSYVIDGPRLFYLPSIGISLFWGSFLLKIEQVRQWWRKALVYGILLALLVTSLRFIQTEIRLFDWGSDLIWSVVNAAKSTKEGDTVLLVNLPAWFAYPTSPFKIGHDGATMVAEYAPLSELIQLHGVSNREIVAVTYPEAFEDVGYFHGFLGPIVSQKKLVKLANQADGVWFTIYHNDGPELVWTGRLSDPEPTSQPFAIFEYDWKLISKDVKENEMMHRWEIALTWECGQFQEENWTVFLHVINAQGTILGQGDGHFLMNSYPLSHCPPGRWMEETRYVPAAVAETHQIIIGIYNTTSMDRLPVLQAEAPSYENAVMLYNSSSE